MKVNNIIFKQADFIKLAVSNVAEALRDGALLVVIILFLFMLDVRVAFVTLTAIPASILITALIFSWFELSINTMTLGGLAIAIGELVDDAIVGVENVRRRLRQAPANFHNINKLIQLVADATIEVRSAILYATLIIALVFVPLFALGNIEGRMFIPLGIAYIVSILASMFVSMTLTPVLSLYLLPKVSQAVKEEGVLIRVLKKADEKLLNWAFDHHKFILSTALVIVLAGVITVPFFARAFLPIFNEGTLTVSVAMKPGTSLTESSKIGQMAESLLLSIPEVSQVGRRTGRAELDEHAEGVHYSEIDAALISGVRSREEVLHDVRTALSNLPAFISVGQPISHRLDHLLSGVRAELVLKIFGPDIDRLRTLAAQWSERLSTIHGLVDLQVEKQVLIPQLQIQINYDKARLYDVTPTAINRAIATLSNGEKIAEIIDNNRFYDVVLRLSEKDRNAKGLANLLVDTPHGPVPLNLIAEVREGLGPNQINRENGQRRIVVYANRESGADMAAVVEEIRMIIAATALPKGYYISLEGQFLAQEEASKQIALLALFALIMIFLLLNNRYKSPLLSLIIMGNIPMALVGSVAALYLSGGVLSIASLIGFITLAGISSRNGILKISHYIHLAQFEGEQFGKKMIIRGSLERLIPVLMTALTAIFALIPLLLSAGEPGKEILHPVAVVIFGGLISAVILDTIVTPVMFYLWGEKPLLKLLKKQST
jgi:HME family heavy-metal exporter